MISPNNELLPHWCVLCLVAVSLLAYVIVASYYGHELWQPMAEPQRIVLRTIGYAIAIVGFPLTNLIRHILLRLNQTMPGRKPAKSRYLLTVCVSLLFVESIGLSGLVLFLLGDDFNTLYIYTGLAVLGLYLYRPKWQEYQNIVEALKGDSS